MNILKKISNKYWDISLKAMKFSSNLGFKSGLKLRYFILFLNKNNRIENFINFIFDLFSIALCVSLFLMFFKSLKFNIIALIIYFALFNIILTLVIRDISFFINGFETN